MEMVPEDYVVEINNRCFVCLQESEPGVGNEWILGDAFLRGFYSAYHYPTGKFGFAPHNNSTKASIKEGEQPKDFLPRIDDIPADELFDYYFPGERD